jgi:exopolyphosphatase/guanosine-5'-triphosphate,3'-diphosphate pyrophosphatase
VTDGAVGEGAVAEGAVAAIDCGTNSTRLLVAGPDGTTLERLMTITRLGAGVDRTQMLAPDAVARTVDVLGRYRTVMDRLGVVRFRITATSAARDATNRRDFFDAARDTVGTEPELLAGEEEGRLSFIGATAELDASSGPWLVADIGGGSTELTAGPLPGSRLLPEAVRSLDMGCVRVTERFLAHDPPRRYEIDSARRFVGDQLDAALAEQPALRRVALVVGLAGTVAAAAALDQRLVDYDRSRVHHYRLAATTVSALVAELSVLDGDGRRRRPGMEEGRVDVIVGGLIVVDELLGRIGVTECLTSESDILDGLVYTLLTPT